MNSDGKGLGQAPLARTSLGLGVVSISLVFGIGLCALMGTRQGWIRVAGTPLFICGASSAFLGAIAALLAVGGLLGKGSRAVSLAGLALGAGGVCLFLFVLQAVGGG